MDWQHYYPGDYSIVKWEALDHSPEAQKVREHLCARIQAALGEGFRPTEPDKTKLPIGELKSSFSTSPDSLDLALTQDSTNTGIGLNVNFPCSGCYIDYYAAKTRRYGTGGEAGRLPLDWKRSLSLEEKRQLGRVLYVRLGGYLHNTNEDDVVSYVVEAIKVVLTYVQRSLFEDPEVVRRRWENSPRIDT